jgi:DNA repair protein RadA/Sms
MLLIAVISKYLRLPIETHDVYVNVVGGLRITDPAADLAIALSIVSSYLEVPLHNTAAVGEIGLDGRVRKVYNINRRLNSLKSSERIVVPPVEEEQKGIFGVRDLKEAVSVIGGEILGTPGID